MSTAPAPQLNMEDNIKAVIRADLPQEVDEALRQRLDQADHIEAELDHVRDQLKTMKDRYQDLQNDNSELSKILNLHDELTIRFNKVQADERALKVEQLKLELAAEQRITKTYSEILSTLVRNPIYKESIVSNVPLMNPGMPPNSQNSYGTAPYVVTATQSNGITKTIE